MELFDGTSWTLLPFNLTSERDDHCTVPLRLLEFFQGGNRVFLKGFKSNLRFEILSQVELTETVSILFYLNQAEPSKSVQVNLNVKICYSINHSLKISLHGLNNLFYSLNSQLFLQKFLISLNDKYNYMKIMLSLGFFFQIGNSGISTSPLTRPVVLGDMTPRKVHGW